MNLQFVTCSGANEHTDIVGLVRLLRAYPIAEVGIQVSDKKCAFNSPRLKWIEQLVWYVNKRKYLINAALHVNSQWVEQFTNGVFAQELAILLSLSDINGDYFFKRIQLNFKIGREQLHPNKDLLVEMMKCCKGRRFILSYNDSNADFIKQLYREGIVFDCLYDESFGEGIAPLERREPVFADIVQGYAGGISPGNVCSILDTIQRAWQQSPTTTGIYIDAEGNLKGEDGHFDLKKAHLYLKRACSWKLSHQFDF